MDIGSRIRDRRRELGWSQERLALEACRRIGVDPGTLGRQEIYRYEKGIRVPRDWLEPIAGALGTAVETLRSEPPVGQTTLTGIWHSWYSYVSTTHGPVSRFHHVLIHEFGSEIKIESISGSNDSPVDLHLDRAGPVLTGTWTERTSSASRYRGATYHGAVQLVVDPTFRNARGLWVGYDKTYTVDSGPWELTFQTPETSDRAVAEFARSADPRAADRAGQGDR